MVTHSSIFAQRIQQTGKPGGLQSIGLQRVGMTEATWHACTWIQHLGLCGCPGTQKENLYVQYYQMLMIRVPVQQLSGTVSLQCPLIFLFVSFLIPCLCLVMEVPSQYSGWCQKGMGFFLLSPTSLKQPESHTFFSPFTQQEGEMLNDS